MEKNFDLCIVIILFLSVDDAILASSFSSFLLCGDAEVDEGMKTEMDTEVDQALHKPEEQIYQVYFDASGGDKAALPDHKKFLKDVFCSRASELDTTVNPINGHG
ncbi:hypothetical protein CsSME_00042871 [Camellia sinensis var. sinensis]